LLCEVAEHVLAQFEREEEQHRSQGRRGPRKAKSVVGPVQ
jgi:hypothetical protein